MHVVCLVGRYRQWNLAVVGLVAAVVAAALIGAMFLPDTMTAGIIPSRATWDTAWQALADSWSQFRVTVTPVPSDGGFGITLALVTALTAFLADGFAFRAFGRAEAVIPGGLLFVVDVVARLRPAAGHLGGLLAGRRARRRRGPAARRPHRGVVALARRRQPGPTGGHAR